MTIRNPYLEALASMLGIGFVWLLPHFSPVPFPFGYTIPVILAIWLLLKWSGETFSDIGFSFKRISTGALLTGIFFGIILFFLLQYVVMPMLARVLHLPKTNLKDFNFLRHNIIGLLVIIPVAWVVGGIYEEIVFHGYIFTRLSRMITRDAGVWISFLAANIIFGAYHYQQGITGMIHAFIAGCAYQFIAIKKDRNLWYAVFFHAAYDTIALTYIYLGYQ